LVTRRRLRARSGIVHDRTRAKKKDALALSGREGRAAGTAKTLSGGAALSASTAEKPCVGRRLRCHHSCGLWRDSSPVFRLREDRPNQRDDPTDERPTGEEVNQKNGREAGFIPGEKRGQKIETNGHNQKNRRKMEKREEQGRNQHSATLQHVRVLSRFPPLWETRFLEEIGFSGLGLSAVNRADSLSQQSETFIDAGVKASIIPAMRQHDLVKLWEEHTADEFVTRDTEATLNTMVDDAYVNHIPTMTGGHGKAELRRFYSRDFIPVMPPDTKLTPVSRTVGEDQIVDEIIFSFTHTQEMPWMLPGVAPTNRRVEIPMIAIVHFREGKLAHEHIYWDQASVLKQLGLLKDASLPVCGVESARKVLDPKYEAKN
jgi:carboxymethylenebutenolidase